MINLVVLIGNLGSDPLTTQVAQGKVVCKFSLATQNTWIDRDGNKQESTDWHKVVCWDRLAETCDKYLHKGSRVYLEGRITTRQFEDKSGNKRELTEILAKKIQFLSAPKDRAAAKPTPDMGEAPDLNSAEELPF